MVTAFHHPGTAAPLGEHPMPIGKFGWVAEALKSMPGVRLAEPAPLECAQLALVHTPRYIEAVQTGEPRALAESQKFPWSPQLFGSVCLTGGGCLCAARTALETGVGAALVSGFHHAFADHGEGFCTFNGLIVTLDVLFAEHRIRRGAVLDLDLHYGNGTASLAETRPHVRAISVYGSDYHENCAYRDVTVRRHRDGQNHCSFALPSGCDRLELERVLERAFDAVLADGKPDLLLYQAGADPYYEDPYSPLALTLEDLRLRDFRVFEFARRERIPVAWVLAGGYTRDVSKVVEVHLNTFRAWLEGGGG
jgi:acetoin utilization deacetylase AcuC-like enzyme